MVGGFTWPVSDDIDNTNKKIISLFFFEVLCGDCEVLIRTAKKTLLFLFSLMKYIRISTNYMEVNSHFALT